MNACTASDRWQNALTILLAYSANTTDHAGGEILLNALDGTWRRGTHEARLELLAMVRSLTQSPEAVIHSPAEIVAAWPTMVARSRCPRAFTRSTQKPVSTL